tara:strand:+ start:569 stop:2800 length:2232 start_codon:yes stop_codon:yes gene_type:complete
MAGFLGTLFMGNVGLRLLTPPRAAYNKMASDFGRGAKLIGTVGQKEHKKAIDMQDKNTRNSVMRSQFLLRQARKTNSAEDVAALKEELMKLNALTDGAIMRVSQALGKGAAANLGLHQQNLGNYENVLGGLEKSGAITSLEEQFESLGDRITHISSTVLNTFQQALSTSVMALTTLGFQTQMAARSLISYEKELVNANSIFQVSNDELYSISDEVIGVGLNYALTYDNMSQALYQFASAGLDAAESQVILADVMKLSMAVQGDSETLGKLLIQTIKGFGMEYSESSKLADQFALAINESLLEYQDLASAVKFAMPFFVSTNQGVEQLLGGLAILTDRALEAGIAGRGLRQALAELAESLGENTRNFQEMGINITDSSGNLLQMTEIAQEFNKHFGEAANDTELLTTLISDLNVRGATAFVHLVQNADEFAEVTEKLANAQGDSARMAEKQMESLSNQIIVTKSAIIGAFLFSEAQEDGTRGVNSFHKSLLDLVQMVREKFTVQLEDSTFILSEFGFQIRDVATKFVTEFTDILDRSLDIIVNFLDSNNHLIDVLKALFVPLNVVIGLFETIPDSLQPAALEFFVLSRMVGGVGASAVFVIRMFSELLQMIPGVNSEVATLAGTLAQIVGSLMIIAGIGSTIFGIGALFTGVGTPAGLGGIMAGSTLASTGVGLLAGGTVFKATENVAATSSGVDAIYDDYAASVGSGVSVGATSTSPTSLNVDNLNIRSDNLNDAFFNAQYST